MASVDDFLISRGHRPLFRLTKTFTKARCPAGCSPDKGEPHEYQFLAARSPFWEHELNLLFSTKGAKCCEYRDPRHAKGQLRHLGKTYGCSFFFRFAMY